jgi:hypothetical protein
MLLSSVGHIFSDMLLLSMVYIIPDMLLSSVYHILPGILLLSVGSVLPDMLLSSMDHVLPDMLLLSVGHILPDSVIVEYGLRLTRHIYYQVWTKSYHTLLWNMDYILLYIVCNCWVWTTSYHALLLSMDYVLTDILLSILDHIVPDMLFIGKYEPHILGIKLIQQMQLGSNHQHHIWIHSEL